MRGYGQKELISMQRELESGSKTKLPIKVGSLVEFPNNPEWNGKVRRISKDQWQSISITYGEDGTKIINGDEFLRLIEKGEIIVAKK